ncbi:MAG TPA: hypothetical protein VF669_13695 [Tepidisphaeraceae bacterium]|jgi:hypothetical protein
MITIRQIERLFSAQQWPQLFAHLTAGRPEFSHLPAQLLPTPAKQHKSSEDSSRTRTLPTQVVPIAALAMIRLEELTQSNHPFFRRLLNVVLTSQQSDGGWGDPVTTALCLRALLSSNGQGASISGGLAYLAGLQKTEGIWPKEPIRRLPADAFTSAFILHQVGEYEAFQTSIRFDDALLWFATHERQLDEPTQRLWRHARTRCRMNPHQGSVHLWSTPHRPAA